ncbi:hypothetical protein GGF32_003757 [Allomyces javanicus]|nr:hypothetical protein GGF32_003757 [Allomyces javanicus]
MCAEWFQGASSADTADKDAQHESFTGVLERVVEILAPRWYTARRAKLACVDDYAASTSAATLDSGMDTITIESLVNRFSVLSTLNDGAEGGATIDDDNDGDLVDIADPCAPSRVLVYGSHLYAACRAYARDQGNDLKWPDLDLFMAVYSRENLFAGREPEKPEDRVKSFNLMRGASITTPLPASLLCRATRSRVLIRQSRDGERQLKQRLYTALFFRDRHACSTATPLERSKKLVSMLNQARVPWLGEQYQLTPAVIAGLRDGTHDLDLETVIQWVYMIATREIGARELRHIDLYLQCLGFLKMMRDGFYTTFAARFDEYYDGKYLHDMAVIVKLVLEDWWFNDAQRHGPDVESLNVIRDATELLEVHLKKFGMVRAMRP